MPVLRNMATISSDTTCYVSSSARPNAWLGIRRRGFGGPFWAPAWRSRHLRHPGLDLDLLELGIAWCWISVATKPQHVHCDGTVDRVDFGLMGQVASHVIESALVHAAHEDGCSGCSSL